MSRRSYIIGFGVSLLLTLASYGLVVQHSLPASFIIFAIMLLALLQLVAQLVFFLHLNKESRPHWNVIALSFAAMVVLIIVLGSLWIMQSLNYQHLHSSPADIDSFIKKDEGID